MVYDEDKCLTENYLDKLKVTITNLKRWGKGVNNRCSFCRNVEILAHILSN